VNVKESASTSRFTHFEQWANKTLSLKPSPARYEKLEWRRISISEPGTCLLARRHGTTALVKTPSTNQNRSVFRKKKLSLSVFRKLERPSSGD
jgi:hypothetical protein